MNNYKKKSIFSGIKILLLFAFGIVIVNSVLSNKTQDNRSKAASIEKVFPVNGTNPYSEVPSYKPDAFVAYKKEHPNTNIIPDSVFVELSIPKNGNCGEKKINCIAMPGLDYINITSCARFDFHEVQNTPLIVRYKQTKESNFGHTCIGDLCNTSPILRILTSLDRNKWLQLTEVPDSWRKTGSTTDGDEQYKLTTIPPKRDYKYVMLCRGGGGSGRASWHINSLYTEKTITPTAVPTTIPVPTVVSKNIYSIYLSTTGNDSNDGLTRSTAIKSLAQAEKLLQAAKPQKDVEIRIAKGTYYDVNTMWHYSHPIFKTQFLPDDGKSPTAVRSQEDMPIFNGKYVGKWLLHIKPKGGEQSNIEFYYLTIKNYVTDGLTITNDLRDESKWNGNNRFYGLHFQNIGNYWYTQYIKCPTTTTSSKFTTDQEEVDIELDKNVATQTPCPPFGYAAIVLGNTRNTIIEKSTFKSLLNIPIDQWLIHGVYFNSYCHDNIVRNNTFDTSTGVFIKTRNFSNNNIISGNTFKGTFPAVFTDGFQVEPCSPSEYHSCKMFHECPSWNNVLKDNTVIGKQGTLIVNKQCSSGTNLEKSTKTDWIITKWCVPDYCTTSIPKNAKRVIMQENIPVKTTQ